MKFCIFSIAFLLFTTIESVFGQYWGTGGGGPGGPNGFGCGATVQHFGNECYQPKTGQAVVVCVGKSF